jgi:saccharopine dehydrogenase-like NADP-dependent oxidoreductase
LFVPQVLVLGAGLSTAPLIPYLSNEAKIAVTVASRTLAKAEALCEGCALANAVQLDVCKEADLVRLEELVQQHDASISMLPYVGDVACERERESTCEYVGVVLVFVCALYVCF